MRFEFQGKTVIVTGGARGIGAAISTLFARSGANVMVRTGSEIVRDRRKPAAF